MHIPDELDVQNFPDAPYGAEICIKSLWKGGGGDSPQCGEMSEGQRGPPLLAEPFLRKVSPDNTHIYFYVVIPLILQSFIIILL